MVESEYIAALKAHWPKGKAASREVLSLACLAVRDFPNSALLWVLRGQLMLMSPEDYVFSKLDAVTSFEKAIELDPSLAEGIERLGDYSDSMKDAAERNKAGKHRGRTPD